jgi:hypothetical protein
VILKVIAENDATIRTIDMSPTPRSADTENIEAEWRAALIQAERLRQEYSHHLGASDTEEPDLERLWLKLWTAERRREELFRAID